MLYRRGNVWWFEFTIGGRRYRETTRTANRALAASVERKRRREIEENINGVRPRVLPPLFSDAADDYLARKQPSWAPKTYVIETTNLEHLKPHFGRLLVTDITDRDIAEYCTAPGFLDSGLTVFASTLPRPARRGRVAPGRASIVVFLQHPLFVVWSA